MKVPNTDLVTVMDEAEKGKSRRVEFPPDFVKEIDKLPQDERRRRLIQYIEEHGEYVEPINGWSPYGPTGDRSAP